MGAPVIAAAALNTRTGRKILGGALIGILLIIGFLITPLVAIPFAVAGAAASTTHRATDAAPVCWFKHGDLVEELSALHLAHTVAFDTSDAGFGPIGWHERLSLAIPRLRRAYAGGCSRGHDRYKPRSWTNAVDEQEWDAWANQAHAN